MAARRGIQLTAEHTRRIAAGEISMNELAGELGITRQTLHVNFRRRGWPTRPTAAEFDHGCRLQEDEYAAEERLPVTAAGATQRPVRHRQGSMSSRPAPAVSQASAPASVPAIGPIDVDAATAEDLVVLARQELANAAFLAISQARNLLAQSQMSPQGLKATVGALGLAADQLERAGYSLEAASHGAPQLIISEMTAEQVAETQAAVEAAKDAINVAE